MDSSPWGLKESDTTEQLTSHKCLGTQSNKYKDRCKIQDTGMNGNNMPRPAGH